MCSRADGVGDHADLGAALEALGALGAADLPALGAQEVLDRVRALVAAQNRIAAELTRTVRRAELAQAPQHDGMASMASWLRGHCRLSPAAAGRLVRAGRALEHLPQVAAAFAAGTVTADQVAVVEDVVRPERLAAAAEQDVDLSGVDAALTQVAATRPHRDLTAVMGHYLARLDPDGSEPDPTEGRSLTFARHSDGTLSFRGQLDPVGGEKLQAAVESIVQVNRPAGDPRSRAQRQADALVQLADNQLAAGILPQLRGNKPQVVVTIGVEDLVDPTAGPGAARTDFGAILSAARARWIACDADLTRIVLDADGRPLDVGRTQRLFPAQIRRAAERRDRGCVFAAASLPSTGATPTTCGTGPTAERPRWTTPRCSASATTPRCTPGSASNDDPTAVGAPTAPTAPRSSSSRPGPADHHWPPPGEPVRQPGDGPRQGRTVSSGQCSAQRADLAS